jgi:hypothetical protein
MGSRGFLPHRVEGVRSPERASRQQLSRCLTERDAFLSSVAISHLTYDEIGARVGVTRQAVHKWGREGVPHKRVRAFCNATGTLLLEQWLFHDRAYREVEGRLRERDRIAAIASYSMQANVA